MNSRRELRRRPKGQGCYCKPLTNFILFKWDEIVLHFIPSEEDVLLSFDDLYALVSDAVQGRCTTWQALCCRAHIWCAVWQALYFELFTSLRAGVDLFSAGICWLLDEMIIVVESCFFRVTNEEDWIDAGGGRTRHFINSGAAKYYYIFLEVISRYS